MKIDLGQVLRKFIFVAIVLLLPLSGVAGAAEGCAMDGSATAHRCCSPSPAPDSSAKSHCSEDQTPDRSPHAGCRGDDGAAAVGFCPDCLASSDGAGNGIPPLGDQNLRVEMTAAPAVEVLDEADRAFDNAFFRMTRSPMGTSIDILSREARFRV